MDQAQPSLFLWKTSRKRCWRNSGWSETISLKNCWLVVEPYPSEKYDFVSWDGDIPNIWKNKK
jgi:hypothetical protein